MALHGKNIIAGEASGTGGKTFVAIDPSTGKSLQPVFFEATEAEIRRAVEQAEVAYQQYRKKSPDQIAGFLDSIADEIMALGDELINRAKEETALPDARLQGERARTCNQLKMFGQLVREGSWVDARIDRAQPDRKPQPRPDMRRMLVPIGPVVVFGASNFPFAFSAAGGDSASALAAGNSVIIKAHPSHPGTSELMGQAVQKAVQKCGMPPAVFSVIQGTSNAVGQALVTHSLVKAVGFTGSLRGGRALFDAAAARPEPIPVYAEMGSVNPIFILPDALATRGDELAQSFVQALTLGVGQFCTNPGLVFGVAGQKFNSFIEKAGQLAAQTPPGTMLNSGICSRYHESIAALQQVSGVRVAGKCASGDPQKTQAGATIFATDANTFFENYALREEVFGPSTILVSGDSAALIKAARVLDGQLTATVHATPKDFNDFRPLLEVLTQKAGRIIFNSYPVGLEVGAATHHGGPYPSTTHSHFTSVGTAAILRFTRPVCYQGFPQELLPPELQDKNVRGIWRQLDGQLSKSDL